MHKHSFIQNIANSLTAGKWSILIIILLAACAPTTQKTEVDHDNTINGCLHEIAEQNITSNRHFVNCVHNTNQQLTSAVRKEINDYLLSATDSELQKMTQVVVEGDSERYMDSTKDEFASLLISEIADILSSKEKSDY